MTDFDVGEDEIIRTIRFITDLQVGATVTGSSSSAPFISLSVTVLLCAPFYIGSSCEIFNQFIASPMLSHAVTEERV